MKGAERRGGTEEIERIRTKSTERNIKKDPNLMSVGGREIRSTEKDQSLQVGIARRKEEPSLTNGMKTSISDLDGVYIYIVSKMIIL